MKPVSSVVVALFDKLDKQKYTSIARMLRSRTRVKLLSCDTVGCLHATILKIKKYKKKCKETCVMIAGTKQAAFRFNISHKYKLEFFLRYAQLIDKIVLIFPDKFLTSEIKQVCESEIKKIFLLDLSRSVKPTIPHREFPIQSRNRKNRK